MFSKNSAPDQPFWVDDPNPYLPANATKRGLTWRFSKLLYIFSLLVRLFALIVFILLALKFPIIWLLVVFEVAIIAVRIFIPRQRDTLAAKATRIQQLAKDKTGAALVGSALHTAGHPLLQVNQPVVLAIKDTELSIYNYNSPIPIDTLNVKDFQAVETVVFDDDHVPHIDVIDNTAQALQLTFPWQGNTCTCLFRRMYKVRPIEWYHAIQTARLFSTN